MNKRNPITASNTLVSEPALARSPDACALQALMSGQSGEFALSLLGTSPDCIKLLSLDGTLTFMSTNGQAAMEIDDVTVVTGKPWWTLWPPAETARLQIAVAKAAQGQTDEFVAACPTAKGTGRWWAVTVSPVLGSEGRVAQILAVSRDVTILMQRQTDLEGALAESEMLRREVDHRVKNSLSLVSSMLNMRARSSADARVSEALQDAAMRVRTIASVHEKLHRTSDDRVQMNDYLSSLCADIQESIGCGMQIAYSGMTSDITVGSHVTLALGLIVAELTGNALRHAALKPGDRIDVEMSSSDKGACILIVRDTGCGLPADFAVDGAGMGMTVVQSMVDKIGGELSWATPANGGTMFSIAFDL